MIMPDYSEEPEKYSSYKKRMFEKKLTKIKMLFDTVDELSLKDADKKKLKNKMRDLTTDL